MTIGVSWLGLSLFAAICFYKFILQPVYFSPLARIPNAHFLAPLTPLWMLWIRYKERENATIHAAHKKFGPVVRLGPNEVSVNCVKGGIHTVYQGGFDKHAFYSNQFWNFGVPNMFSTVQSKPHSIRKRMVSNIYSKSYLQGSKTLSAISSTIVYERLLPKLSDAARDDKAVNFFAALCATTMDLVTAYIFGLGNSTKFLLDTAACDHHLSLYSSRISHKFWVAELPSLTRILSKIGVRLIPKFVDAGNKEIGGMALSMCDQAAKTLEYSQGNYESLKDTGNYPEVYAQLSSTIPKDPESLKRDGYQYKIHDPKNPRLAIGSELIDHYVAGFETSAISLTYLTRELSKQPSLQNALRKELLTLDPPVIASSAPNLPSAKSVDGLPVLHAIVYETLRLFTAIPGPQPRVTPAAGCILGPSGDYTCIPGGVRISAQAYSLHREAHIFDQPNEWRPERWLCYSSNEDGDSKRNVGEGIDAAPDRVDLEDLGKLASIALRTDAAAREMHRYFWAFGSGGRMCVGSNLALFQMKLIVATIYSNFITDIEDDEGVEQIDAYTAPPKRWRLMLKLKAVSE